MAKYIETQFHKSRSESSIVTGPISLVGLALGFLLSGLTISRYRPRAKYVLLYNVIVGGIYLFGHIANLFLACTTSDDLILRRNFDSNSAMNFSRDCNTNCNCDSVTYNPICNSEGSEAYFSPCHAGCETYNEITKTFTDCTCSETLFATLGTCVKGCGYGFIIFTSIAAINNFLSASGRVGNTLVNYRYLNFFFIFLIKIHKKYFFSCISKRDKSSAQGFILMIVSLAYLLSPIIFANIIDSTCLVWTESCGKRGSCQLYDQTMFRYKFNGVAVGKKCLCDLSA